MQFHPQRVLIALAMISLCWIVSCFPQLERKRNAIDIQESLERAGKVRLGIESTRMLPKEFSLFEQFRQVRALGYNPVWRKDRYLIREQTSGQEINPFLWKQSFRKTRRPRGDITLYLTSSSDHDILLYDVFENQMLGYDMLYRCKIYDVRVVIRGGRYFALDHIQQKDEEITFEQVILKDAAVRFNWYKSRPSDGMVCDEAILRDYGFVMRKANGRYIPVALGTGKQLVLPARAFVIERALRQINELSKKYGMDFSTEEKFRQTGGSFVNGSPEIFGAVAMTTLKLYGVEIRWSGDIGLYEIVR